MSISKAKFNGALKTFKRLDSEVRASMLTTYTFIAFHTLAHGNKAPLDQLKDTNGVAAWIKAGAARAVMSQDVRYRTDTESGWKLAESHALAVVEKILDRKEDQSEEAKAKREAAKAKREAEALKLKEQERELEAAQNERDKLELELAKAKSKLKDAAPKKTGGRVTKQDATQPGEVVQVEKYRLIHTLPQGDGKDECIDLSPEEFEAAKAAVQALRRSQQQLKKVS
jgi:hypothetical protein